MDRAQTIPDITDITETNDLVDLIDSWDISPNQTDVGDVTKQERFIQLIISCLATKPYVFNAKVYESVSFYNEHSNMALAQGYITPDNLKLLSTSSNSHTTWLKYEMLLCYLIRNKQLTPKILAEEILTTIKHDLDQNILASVSSVLSSCVRRCRQVNPKNADDEDEEKWCEILDWLAWFCSSNDGEI